MAKHLEERKVDRNAGKHSLSDKVKKRRKRKKKRLDEIMKKSR